MALPLIMEQTFKTFTEFYPFYLGEHSKKGTRILHFIGTFLFFVFFVSLLFTGNSKLIAPTIITPYAFAWVGHFFVEKNKPATFKYPLFSLCGDFRLFFELLIGKQKFNPTK